MTKTNLEKKTLTLWFFSFFLANLILVYVIAFQYVPNLAPLKLYYFAQEQFNEGGLGVKITVVAYLVITYLSYFAFLTAIPLIPGLLASLIQRNLFLVKVISIACYFMFFIFLLMDTYIFTLYRFHLNQSVFSMLLSTEAYAIFNLSTEEWLVLFSFLVTILSMEILAARYAWRIIAFYWIKPFLLVTSFFMLTSLSIATFADKPYYLQQAQSFPYYTELVRTLFSIPKGHINKLINGKYFTQSNFPKTPLAYPKKPVICHKKDKPLNIFIIFIDTWRYDALSAKITPNIYSFASKNILFSNHLSGGNATQPGVFSFFYGLPATYWTAFYNQKRGPLFIKKIVEYPYQIGLFSSASLSIPDFISTVFRKIEPSTIKQFSGSPIVRDKKVTQQFLLFLKNVDKTKPIFSFIFYDGAHGYCGGREEQGPFQPELKSCNRYRLNNQFSRESLFNRYLNSVYFVDQEIGEIVQGLQKEDLLAHSIVIISADHGEEFNDNHQNYWGHTSNFTDYQLKVPLIIHWPHKAKAQYTHLTTHYDIVPTLLKEVFGCTTASENYAYGKNIFKKSNRYPLIVANNYCLGYISKEQRTTLFPSGDFIVQDKRGQTLDHVKPKPDELIQVFKKLTHFYK